MSLGCSALEKALACPLPQCPSIPAATGEGPDAAACAHHPHRARGCDGLSVELQKHQHVKVAPRAFPCQPFVSRDVLPSNFRLLQSAF